MKLALCKNVSFPNIFPEKSHSSKNLNFFLDSYQSYKHETFEYCLLFFIHLLTALKNLFLQGKLPRLTQFRKKSVRKIVKVIAVERASHKKLHTINRPLPRANRIANFEQTYS